MGAFICFCVCELAALVIIFFLRMVGLTNNLIFTVYGNCGSGDRRNASGAISIHVGDLLGSGCGKLNGDYA